MIHIAFIVLLQVSGPVVAEPQAAKSGEPEIVCTLEPVTGTRARKQRVCKPVGGFDPRSERAQEILRAIQGAGGNGQPKPPPMPGGGPG